jgi:hypothetical protein
VSTACAVGCRGGAARAREGGDDALNRVESTRLPWHGSQGRPATACRVRHGHRRARA